MRYHYYDKKKGKKILVGEKIDRVLIKTVDNPKHLVRKYQGYALQKEVVDWLDIDKIKFLQTDGAYYEIDFALFKKLAFIDNLGHGEQYIIPLRYLKPCTTYSIR